MDLCRETIVRVSQNSQCIRKTRSSDRIFNLTHKTVMINWIIFLFPLILIPVSQSRPIERPNYSLNKLRTIHHGNATSTVVRVIVTSSSSSSSRPSISNQHTPFYNQNPHPTQLPMSQYPPTTYHPQFTQFINPTRHQPLQQSRHFQHYFQHEPIRFQEQRNLNTQNIQQQEHVQNFQQKLKPHDDIFKSFFNQFTNRQSGLPQPFPIPIYPTPGPEQLVSVVSQSQSVSASATTQANPRKLSNRRHQQQQHILMMQRRSDDESSSDQYFSLPHAEALVQNDSPQIQESHTTESKNWEEPEKNWEEPEKIWGIPERNWEEEESRTWEAQKQNPKTTSTTQSPFDAEEDSSIRFYELGEDEEDEPKELIPDKKTMETTIESAQLAARSYELPELSQLSHLPTQSFARTASDGMTAESIQIPLLRANMPKVRMTLETGAKGKAIVTSQETKIPDPLLQESGKKFGYVLDGSNVRKYRVEERTPDGWIVGEYGVLNHNNGFLRGVRYTADGQINPKLIHEALMKFLSL